MTGICFRCLPWRQFQLTFSNERSHSMGKRASGCLQGRSHILAVFSGWLFPRGKVMYLPSATCAKVDGTWSKEGRGGEGNGKTLRGKIGRGTERSSNASPPPSLPSANLIRSDLFCVSCSTTNHGVTEIKNALVLLSHFSRVLKNSRVLIQLNNARGTSFCLL